MAIRPKYCGIGCCSIAAFIVLIIFLGTYISPLSKYKDIYSVDCNITRVDYPITYPTSNNTENWCRCDCGKRCTSWSPCINIYSNIKPDVVIYSSLLNYHDGECTFHNDDCS